MKGKRLILEASAPLPASTAVTVEYKDALFLGEIVVCARMNGLWKIEVKVEQIRTGLQSLIALRARLLYESALQPLATAGTADEYSY